MNEVLQGLCESSIPMSSGYADEHSKLACAVHSLSTTLLYTPLPRGASFFAAPKKEGKKRAFLSGIYWLTAFGRVTFNHIDEDLYGHFA